MPNTRSSCQEKQISEVGEKIDIGIYLIKKGGIFQIRQSFLEFRKVVGIYKLCYQESLRIDWESLHSMYSPDREGARHHSLAFSDSD